MGRQRSAILASQEAATSACWQESSIVQELASPAIDRAASRIAAVRRRHSIAAACEVGAIVVDEIYRGDLVALRSRGAKDESLRRLAAHPRLDVSAATLWRAVGVFLLCERMPGLREPKHLALGHFYAVLGLGEERQERLLRAAEIERWPREKLEASAGAGRASRGGDDARRDIQRCATLMRRLTALPVPRVDGASDDEVLNQLERALTDVERWTSEIRRGLAAAREMARRASAQPTVRS